ncbi:MAG: ABC transporter ATP-binding protein [Pseudomonadota bacterium]
MALRLEDVAKTVDGVGHIHPTTLAFERGTMNVLLGRTLAGKTTIMRIMAGLDVPTAGRVHWDGADVTGHRVQDRDVAMVYQQFINYPSMTVYDNIASPLRLRRAPAAEIDRKVRESAALMKLDESQLGRRPLELSGGQQQRCALARALVKEAGLVLLDEPLANLDYKLREELRAEIPRIFQASGSIFVYATTEPHEALLLGGNTACLWEGRVTQFGPTAQVYRRPEDAVTAEVFSDPPMNFVQLTKSGETLTHAEGSFAAEGLSAVPDGQYRAGFRANHVSLDPMAGGLTFQATSTGTEITGSESYVHLDHQGARWVARVGGVRDVAAGAPVEVHVRAEHVYLFDALGRLAQGAAYAEAA